MVKSWMSVVHQSILDQLRRNPGVKNDVYWTMQGMSSLWRFGRHSLSSTSDGNDGIPAASASVDSSVDIPLTKTLPVLMPLPEEG